MTYHGVVSTDPEDKRADDNVYDVVVNHEEQYSIWPSHRDLALGWNKVGKQGTKTECLDFIEEVWTDMRPLSVRRRVEIETPGA
jgi:MbtH protein